MAFSGYSQTIAFQETFETTPLSVTSSGNPGWSRSHRFAKTGTYSDSSKVATADTSYLTTNAFSTVGNSYVVLEFAQICKIEFFDGAVIEVSANNGVNWTKLVAAQYLGGGQFGTQGDKFSAASYPIWDPGTATTVPQNAWWKSEIFDISSIAANKASVKVRFKLYDGNNTGSAGNYGWLIDDIKVTKAASELIPPVVTLQAPIFQDTIYTTNPYEIKALITDASGIDTAYIVYKVNNGTPVTLGMTLIGSNVYHAFIPGQTYNRHVDYQVFAVDASPAANVGQSVTKWFYVKKGPSIVQIGTGTATQTFPFYEYYGYTRSASIYSSSEINMSGIINSLQWEVATAASASCPVKIYLKSTTLSTFATADTWANLTSGATLVYNGTTSFSTVGWQSFIPTASFNYTTGNLMVLCEANYGGSGVSPYAYFNYTSTTGNTHQDYNQDNTPPTTTGYLNTSRPNIKIGFPAISLAHDAGVKQINTPTGTILSGVNTPVTLLIKNYALDTLVKTTIAWKLDGVTQTSYSWVGSLLEAITSAPITIGNINVGNGSHTIKAWTELPNDSIDQNHSNDTVSISFYACSSILNGTYTIGTSGANYPSFSAALSAMQNCGISGPVIFNVQSGTYTEQLSIPEINGVSATNTITFQSLTGNNNNVILQFATTSSNNYVVKLDGADYIRFKNMTLRSNGITYAHVIEMSGNATYNQFTGNKIIGKDTTSTSSDFALVYSASGANSIDSVSVFNNNTFTNGSYGMYYWGGSETALENKTSITNNTFTNQYYTGIYLFYQNAPLISGNTITTNTLYSSYYGIYAGYCDNGMKILKNKIAIQNGGYGVYIYFSDGLTGTPGLTANNFIQVGGTSTAYGLYPYYSTYQNFYYNSVNITSNSAANGSAMYLNYGCTVIDLKNNILANNGGGYSFYSVITAGVTSNYNDLYTSGTKLGYWNADCANIAAWRTTSLQDANSISINPSYSSITNLHTFDIGLNALATPVASVTDDIDGEVRNVTTPDIGADEFAPLATDLGILSVVTPVSGCSLGTNENVTIKLKNLGGNPITSADIYYRLNNGTPVHGVFTGNIPSNTTFNYTFTQQANLSAIGNYNFKFYVVLSGDMNILNDTLSNYIVSNGWDFYSSAYTMGFETTDDMSLWSSNDVNADGYTWTFPTVGSSHSGANSAQLYNGASTGNDWMFSRCMKLSAGSTYKIEFWYKAGYNYSAQSIDLKVGNNNTPAAMTTSLLSLASFVNTNYQKASVTFTPSTTGSYNFGWWGHSTSTYSYGYIDDINISLVPPQEATMLAVAAPVSGCGLSSTEPVSIKIKNTGSDTINGNLTAYFKFNGGATFSAPVTNTILPNDTALFTFSQTIDPHVVSSDAVFPLKVWLTLTGDPFQFNDTLNYSIASSHVPVNPVTTNTSILYGAQATLHATSADSVFWYNLPAGGTSIASGHTFITPHLFANTVYYAQSITPGGTTSWTFDSGLQGWTVQNPCTSSTNWAWNADGGDGALFAADPSVSSYQLITSPSVMISGTSSVALSFNHHFDTESCCDEGYVAYKLDGGPWTQFIPTVNSYNVASQNIDNDPLNSCVSDNKSCFAGTQTYINTSRTINTSGASNIQLAFVFTSDPSVGYTGWFINDVTLSGGMGGCVSARVPDSVHVIMPAYEAELVDITAPVNKSCTFGSEHITIQIKNNGIQTISSGLNATYRVNNSTPVTQTVSTPIPSGATISFTFTTPVTVSLTSGDTILNIKAYVTQTGDPYHLNDTLIKSVKLLYTPNPPTATSPVTIPYGTSTTLTATSPQIMKWFNASTGGTQLGQGSHYITPVLYDTTTYYVEANNTILGIQTTVGTGTSYSYQLPTNGWYNYSWTASIYKASELGFVGNIDTIMYSVYNSTTTPFVMNNQMVYMALTTDTVFATADKPDPATMTQVFSNTISWVPGLFKIPLQTQFNYDGTSNIIVYWENHDGSYTSGYPNFYYSVADVNANKYQYQDASFPTQAGYLTTTRPNARFSHSVIGCPSLRTPVQVNLSNFPNNDAGVVSIDAPTSPTGFGIQDVKVTLKNYGASNLNNVTINWKVNGVAQSPFSWVGTLANQQTLSNIIIGTYNFTLGTYNFKAWTTNPNGASDIYNLNDTAYKVIDSYEPLNGIYTIGGTSPDFPTFTAARNALALWGVSGPVTFKVRTGTYNEKLKLTAYTGASAINTVTFMPDANATVTLTATDTFVVKIQNASYFIFDGSNNGTNSKDFSIINNSTSLNTAAIWLSPVSNDITIKNCKISTGNNSNGATFGIYAGGTTISSSGTGNNNNITLHNNTITKAYYGIYAYAPTTTLNNNLIITNNFIGSNSASEYVLFRGVDIQSATAPLIEGNDIINMQVATSVNVSGVEIGQYVTDAKISKNKISGLRSTSTSGYGAYGIDINSSTNVSGIEISNNFISDIVTANYSSASTLWNPFGIRINGGTGHKIWHNSIHMYGAPANGSSPSMSAALLVTTSAVTGLDVRNNVFVNKMTGLAGSKAYAIYIASGTTFNKIDYNDYFVSGAFGFVGYSGAADVADLAGWKLVTIMDTNSLSTNPSFLTNNNLHTFSTSINGKGTHIAAVTDDIDGEARNAITPDMGADEFDPLNYDIGLVEVVSPSDNCGLTSNEVIAVNVKNNGQNTINTFTISYTINGGTPVTQTFNGALASDSLHSFTFTTPANLAAISPYTIFFHVNLTGDQYALNDTMTYYLPPIHDFANAYTMGFEPGEDVNAWSVLNVLSDASSWQIPYNSATYAHTGSNSAEFVNSYSSAGDDWMFSPCFTLEANKSYKMEFYYKAQSVSYPQNIKVLFGHDKTPVAMTDTVIVLNGFNNTTYLKASAIINITSTGTYYFGWHAYSTASYYYAYVDDINIRLLAPKDAGVTDLVNISPVMNGGDVIGLQAKIRNFGADTLYSIPVKYSINGGTPVTETWMGTLLPDSSVTHTFATTFNVPDNQFTICSWTQLANDGNTGNDTLCAGAFGIPLLTVPFTDDFEGANNFYVTGLNNEWQHGIPTASVINTAHSPVNVWATNLAGNYSNSSNYSLYSPRFSFIGIVNAQIGFWHWYATEASFDGGRLQYTTNNGNTWMTLGVVSDPLGTNWYTHSGINGAPAFSGSSNGWVFSSYDLSQFNNYPVPVQFRFNFYSNVSNNANGWAIDDFEIIQNQIAKDAGVSAIVSPTSQVVIGSQQTVTVTIKNYGTDALTTIPVRYRVNNGVPVSEQWTGNLASGATTNYTFTTPLVQTTPFNLCAYTKVLNDTYTQNDTTCMAVQILPAQFDAGITEITTPGTQTTQGTPVTVSVKIKNFGSQTLNSVDLQYDINAGTPAVNTYTGTINPGTEVTHTFTQTYISPTGSYIICAKTNLTSEQNTTNDKICKTVTGTVGIETNEGNGFSLGQNMPNPAYGNTIIPYTLPTNGSIRFEIVNVIGQVVYAIEDEKIAGRNIIEINADKLINGVYYYTLTFNEQRLVRKLVVNK